MSEQEARIAQLEKAIGQWRTMTVVALVVAILGSAAAIAGWGRAGQVNDIRRHLVTERISVVDETGEKIVSIGQVPVGIVGGSVTVYGPRLEQGGDGSWKGTASLGVHQDGGFVSISRGVGQELVRLSEAPNGSGLVQVFKDGEETQRLGPPRKSETSTESDEGETPSASSEEQSENGESA